MNSKILDGIIRREGSLTCNPHDRGGITKFGITRNTLADYRGYAATDADVRGLVESDARAIYNKLYISPFETITDDAVKEFLVDCAVNHGVQRAVKFLQKVLQLQQDGIIGMNTSAACASADKENIFRRLVAERIKFYGNIIAQDKTQATFASGWMNRVAEFL